MVFTDIFIKRPVLAFVLNILILLVGLRAAFDLPVRQYPEIEQAVITVTTGYPGASPELMQGFVTTPIAQAIATAEGVDFLVSNSRQGSSSISAHLKINADSDKAMTEIMAKINQVKYLIPQEANDPVILKSTGEITAIMYIGFASDELSTPAITDYLIRVIQPMLATVEGVAGAEVIGGQTLAMRLWLDPDKMAARKITATDVAAAVRANNYQSAPGQMKGAYIVTNIDTNTDLLSVEEFRDLVVKSVDGSVVRMRDIGAIELGAASYDQSALMDGKRAVYLGVTSTPTGNPLEIVKDVRQVLEDLKPGMPPSMHVDVPFDVTVFINAAIHEVVKTLMEAVLIVVIVIFLFLGSVRSVVIPVVAIPLSMIGAAFVMLALGFSINLLTLLAMVMAIGLVVDDAIVVVENVFRHIEEGKTPVQAAILGAREIVGPIIAMTITLAAVYAPIGFMGGVTGSLFREFAFALAGSVIISGVVALTLSPMMCSLVLKHGMNEDGFAKRVNDAFIRIENFYVRRLKGTLDYRPVTIFFAACILGLLVFMFMGARKELAPEEDQGVVVTASKAPQYANIDYSMNYAKDMERIFKETPEVASTFVLSGMDGPSNGFGGFTLKDWKERDRSAMEIQQDIQQKVDAIEGMMVFAFSIPPLPGSSGGMPVQMVIRSTEGYESIFRVMEQLKEEARKSGMFMISDSDLNFNTPVVEIEIDREKANQMGVTMQGVGDTLTLLLGGNYVNRFNMDGRSYDVIPQVPRRDRITPDELTSYYVRAANGDMVPLSTLVKVTMRNQPDKLVQFNQLNSATFSAVPLPGVTLGDAVAFLESKSRELLPDGYSHDWMSNTRQYVQEGNQLIVTFMFALVVIFLVLAAQFESFRDPLVIMISVPLAVTGALLPIFLGAATLNIYTQIGLVTLVGLISKHGILMVEFANKAQVEKGLDRRGAIELAARVRLRPILMTTAAMVAGLLPLVVADGAGAASRFNIGLVIVAGMLIGTLFTLLILPSFYTLIAKDHKASRTSRRNEEISML
ncbi:MAG: MexW/MexI family multidrug efflux RND transporter permease subunit [Micavibrio aeruginosavorus]|uniref:MexW/MexI family multidrug efflux RND transporter permease subunit n=1 Tax=Micavibrio aeruginosavorus TaxID=349221 RepID=A0A7T5R1F7_9BACT|nr:MAG: MexW/MexI family multidrug efflux RND transporter permease subunit [Micavibrio aeruginosavorus]